MKHRIYRNKEGWEYQVRAELHPGIVSAILAKENRYKPFIRNLALADAKEWEPCGARFLWTDEQQAEEDLADYAKQYGLTEKG